MSDIIQLLPDAIANQIAAGEVVQRPASVVKELVENAVDSGATSITVQLKDCGKTFIQVIDNGCGMTETDARMAFERHATSKIKKADDLFCIRTKGFRGEALASIAAVADVNLKTQRHDEQIGSEIHIKASEIVKQEPVACQPGCNFMVRNLFFNIPARRKFLKKDKTELNHIINEFQHVALAHPNISFVLKNDHSEIYHLNKGTLKERIVKIFGRSINQSLANVQTESSLIKIKGFICKPEIAKKRMGEQFFFINDRFMKHPYFNKAVMNAYEQLLQSGTFPTYFLFLEADPSTIDVNIHPTKTEIKFENEQAIFQIVNSAVREGLGKFNIIPSIDFDTGGIVDIPVADSTKEIRQPQINVNPNYNPFSSNIPKFSSGSHNSVSQHDIDNAANWNKLYEGFEQKSSNTEQNEQGQMFNDKKEYSGPSFIHLKNKYIMTPVKSGVMIIDQKRAHQRILFEQYLSTLDGKMGISQQNLYPEAIELSTEDFILLKDVLEDLSKAGFDIREFGKNTIVVHGLPAEVSDIDSNFVIQKIIDELKMHDGKTDMNMKEKIASILAKTAAIDYGKSLNNKEMQDLFDRLFACSMPNYSPFGKSTLFILNFEELEKKLQ